MRISSLAIVSVALILPSAGIAAGITEQSWIEVRTSHFIIDSTLSERTTVELAQDLEGFRKLISVITSVRQFDERVPTRIYAFSRTVPELGLTRGLGGYFMEGMRGNIATMRSDTGMPLAQVIQHEYTHFLVHNRDVVVYPPWFDEGFAEVLSTAAIRDRSFRFGEFSDSRAMALQMESWLPIEQVIDTHPYARKRTEHEEMMFEPQAMILTHYLLFGRPKGRFGQENMDYVQKVEAGKSSRAAFEEAFGEDLQSLNTRLNHYFHHAKFFKGELHEGVQPTDVKVIRIPRDVIAAGLGNIALSRGSSEAAQGFFAESKVANPMNADAIKGQAEVASLGGRDQEAEALYARAIELDPRNDLHHLDYAEHLLRLESKESTSEARKAGLARVRQELVRAHDLNPDNPETLAEYGGTFMQPGEDPRKGLDTLFLAHQLLPGNLDITMLLARLYVALDRTNDAVPLFRRVVAWSHDQRRRDQAARMLAKLDSSSAEASGGGATPGAQNGN